MVADKLVVSVIIPNLNGKPLLEECLSSLERQTFKDFEVIVVDNGSQDGSVDLVKSKFPWVEKIIVNETNLGFAAACNQGIKASVGTYIALLNNDTAAHPDWLLRLVSAAEEHKTCGMFASKTLFYDRRDIIDSTGHLIYPDGLNRARGRLEIDRGQYDDKPDVFFPSGCAALYRKEMFDQIGLFDEYHFAYGDDTDIGIRGRLAGWGCLFVPDAIVYHKYSKTMGEYSPQKAFLVERNRIWIVWKYFPIKYMIRAPFYSLARYLYQLYGVFKGKGAAARYTERYPAHGLFVAVVKAYISALSGAPRVFAERSRLRKLRKVADAEIDRWFKEYRMSLKEISLKD